MWLKKTLWFLLYLLKYWIVCGIVAGIVKFFYPLAGLIVGILLFIGSFGAAYNDLKEKAVPNLNHKVLKKKFSKVKGEFDGFDEVLRTIQRNF
jgi:hypothetical protein